MRPIKVAMPNTIPISPLIADKICTPTLSLCTKAYLRYIIYYIKIPKFCQQSHKKVI